MSEEAVNEESNQAEGFKPIESQADLDRIIQARLERERKKHPSEDELSELRQKADRFQSFEAEKASEVSAASERAKKAEAEALRWRVIVNHEIPKDLHDLVDGDSEEVLVKKAEALSSTLAARKYESTVNTSEAPRMPLEGKAPNSFALNSDEVENSLKRALGISN